MSVNSVSLAAVSPTAPVSITHSRYRLYGMCLVIALSFLLMARCINEGGSWVQMYLPLAGLTILMLSLAGAEYQLYTQRVDSERQAQAAERERAEALAVERQRAFNRLWQALADCRGARSVPELLMKELADLFAADLVAVWAADGRTGGFELRGVHPYAEERAVRLNKVGQLSPCFELVQTRCQQVRVTDFARQTTPALAWFCEEAGLQQAVMSPVLVRQELIGVLAFFYRQKTPVSRRAVAEMQAAANLFLCTL